MPVKAPDAEHAVLVGSGADGAAPVRERLTRLGPDGIVGLVDEPADLAARGETGPALGGAGQRGRRAPHRAGPALGRVGPALGGARLPRVRIDQSGVGDSPTPPGRADDRAFAPEWIDDMRHVVTELAADGAQVGIVGLCSGSYSAFEVAMWEHVDAVFAINPRLTLYRRPRARRSTPTGGGRDAAQRPFARLARRRRILAGGLSGCCRGFAALARALLVLWRVLRRGTAVQASPARRRPALHRGLRPASAAAVVDRRRHGFRTFDSRPPTPRHSLLTRQAQLIGYERATAFLDRYLTAKAAR